MDDNQKEVPSSNFDLTGDGSAMYDSDSQLRTAIVRRLLNEYRNTNYFLANAMQTTFLRFLIHDSYSSMSPPEYNRPKSDTNYYESTDNDHIKIEEINEPCFDNNMSKINERRNEMNYGKSNKFSKNNVESEFDTSSSRSQREESVLLTGRTMHVGYENSCYTNRSSDSGKDFKFVDIEMNKQMQEFADKPSSVKSTESSSEEDTHFAQLFPQWKKIKRCKDIIQESAHSSRRAEKTISCSFNDSNRSSIDNYNDDTNNSSERKESKCNKGKCKPSELASKDMSDKKSNNNDEYEIPPRRETKWQVFCELYEELNSSHKDQNSDNTTSTESIKSRVKYYDSRKTSSNSSLERKINKAINKLKVNEPAASKTKKTLKNNENFRLKLNSRYNNQKCIDIDETSSDTEEVLIRNRYMRNKRMYNTKKYFTNKFRRNNKKRRNQAELQTTTTSSDDHDFFTAKPKPKPINNTMSEHHQKIPPKQFGQTKLEIPQYQQKYAENTHKMTQSQQKCAENMTHFQQKCVENSHKMTQLQQKPGETSHKMTQLQQKPGETSHKMTQLQLKPVETSHKMTQSQQKSGETFHKMTQSQQKSGETSHKMTQCQQVCAETSHKMNDKLIHETIFENSDEEPCPHAPYPNYFQTFMEKYNTNYELIHKKGCTNLAAKRCHQESSTITCDDYSKNNQSFNPNETSCACAQANNSNVSIDKIANSGHSTSSSSFDSIDDKSIPLPSLASNSEDTQRQQKQPENLTKMSTSTICLKSSSGAVDSGLGTSVSEIKPIENVFIIKKPDEDEITVAPKCATSNSSSEWSKICKAKLTVSKLPFSFSSSSKSKSSSDNEEMIKCKQKMRVIFKREATVIDLYNPIPCVQTPVLSLNDNGLDLRKKKRFHWFRRLFFCCSR